MTLYVNNNNDVILREVRYNLDENDQISGANFLVSLLQENSASVTNVSSHATAPVITLSSNPGFEIGDVIFLNRVLGAESVNGFHTITNVSSNDITIAGDTSLETYESGGKMRYVVSQENATIKETIDGEEVYHYTFPDTVDMIPEQDYVLLIQESALGVEIEFPESAQIRVSGA